MQRSKKIIHRIEHVMKDHWESPGRSEKEPHGTPKMENIIKEIKKMG